MESSTINVWISLFLIAGCLACFHYYYVLEKFLYLILPAVSDLGLHCLPMTLLGLSCLNWANAVLSVTILVLILRTTSLHIANLEMPQQTPGPSCSKLTTSLVNDSLKFTWSDMQIC